MTIARPESGEAGARAIARIPATSVPIAARGSGRGRPIDARARSASKRRLKRTWRPVSAIRTAGNASPRPRLSSSARAIGVSASTARVRRTIAAYLRSAITIASSAWTVYRVGTAEEIHPFAIRRATNAWDASAIAIVGAILPCVNPRASGACSACPARNAARTMKGKVFVQTNAVLPERCMSSHAISSASASDAMMSAPRMLIAQRIGRSVMHRSASSVRLRAIAKTLFSYARIIPAS